MGGFSGSSSPGVCVNRCNSPEGDDTKLMEALFHETLALPPQDTDAFVATVQVMDLDGAVCMQDDGRKESGQGVGEKAEEEMKKTLEGQQQQAQQDGGMKKI